MSERSERTGGLGAGERSRRAERGDRVSSVHGKLRLGTRGSALALAQSGMVADVVRARTGWEVELVE
ncbi:MAG: hypothetical protein JWP76_6014, partial [Dactylosporangium sp.]|nr:hypothetical protein [Dactylosporangium sp.]